MFSPRVRFSYMLKFDGWKIFVAKFFKTYVRFLTLPSVIFFKFRTYVIAFINSSKSICDASPIALTNQDVKLA